MESVGLIGLGNMGAAIAQRIRSASFELSVCDVCPEAARAALDSGARRAASPAEVARTSDIVLSSLPAPREVERVLKKALPIYATGAIGAIASELGLDWRLCRGIAVIGRAVGLVGHICAVDCQINALP